VSQAVAALGLVRGRLARAAIVLDYDGTLAPIVDRPEHAIPAAGAVEVLVALASLVRVVAIVTGRPSGFVRSRLPVAGLTVVGLYGSEDAPDLGADVLRAVASIARSEEGASVEDKGPAVAVHVRLAPDPDGAADRLRGPLAAIADESGLALLEGKRVLELAPANSSKADAVLAVAQGAEAVMIAGDDTADVASFAALDIVEASGVPVLRVAVAGPETPDELRRLADLIVAGPEGLLDLLRGF